MICKKIRRGKKSQKCLYFGTTLANTKYQSTRITNFVLLLKKGLCITKYKKSEYNTIVEVRKIHKLNVIHHERSFPNVLLLRISPNCLPLLHWYIFLVNVTYQQFPICISDMDLLFAVWWFGCIAQNTKKNSRIHSESNTLIIQDPLRTKVFCKPTFYRAQYSRLCCNEKLNSF